MNDGEKIELLYSDVIRKGGLLSTVREMFKDDLTGIEVNGFGTGQSYAHLQLGRRSSQILLCLDERLFLIDFWETGQKRAWASSRELADVKTMIQMWMEQSSIDAMSERFPSIQKRNSS